MKLHTCRRYVYTATLCCAAAFCCSLDGCGTRKPPPEIDTQPAVYELEYALREGESLVDVAIRFYNDPSREEYLSQYNGIEAGDRSLAPGLILRIPFDEDQYVRFKRFVSSRTAYNRGLFYSTVEDYDRAIQEFHIAVQHDSTFVTALYNISLAYWKSNRTEQAIQTMKEAIDLKPGDDCFHYALGSIYFQSGLTSLALREFAESARLNPENPDSLYAYAFLLEHMEHYEQALERWHVFLESFPDSSRTADVEERSRRLSSIIK
jgi:tetratricopeptide (TPR) repeat protein